MAVDTVGARRLIAAAFPSLADASLESLGVGWDNGAFLVDGTLVFRFPRRQIAVPLLETEARVLPAIAPHLPLPVPVPTYVGAPAGDYPWPFAGYALLPGTTACRARLTEAERAALAAPLGEFLAALHRIDPTPLGLSKDTIGRMDLARRRTLGRERLAAAIEKGLVDDSGALETLFESLPPNDTPRTETLVHGDLYVRHLLISPERTLCGVIDWGDCHVGDPALDLSIAWIVLPPAARPDFFAAYGPVPEEVATVAAFRALWHTLTVLLYADAIGDDDLRREARWTLRQWSTESLGTETERDRFTR